jgi:hypothetical protein
MYTKSYALIFFAVSTSLFGADPGVGTWKLNTAKSHFPPGQSAPKELVNVVQQHANEVDVNLKGQGADGMPISIRYTFPMEGGSAKYSEGAPAAGTTMAVSKLNVNNNSREFRTMRDGKEIQVGHVVITNQAMTQTIKGVDSQGKPFEAVIIMDKQ